MEFMRPLLVELKTEPLHLRLTAGGIVYGVALTPAQAQSLGLALLANCPQELLPEVREEIEATGVEYLARDRAVLRELGASDVQ